MIRKDAPLTNQSSHAAEESFQRGENRGVYKQNVLGNRQLNTSGSATNNSGAMLNNAGFPPNTGGVGPNRNQTPYNSQPLQSSGPPVPNNNPPVNTSTSLSSGLPTNRGPPLASSGQTTNSGSVYNNSPISSGPPLSNSLPLNSGPSSQSTLPSNSAPIFNRSSVNSGPPPNSSNPPLNNGPTTISRSPVNIGLQPKIGPPIQNKSPVSSGPPMSSGLQSSSGPALQNRSPITTGMQLSSSRPSIQNRSPVSSGSQTPQTNSLPLSNGPPMYSSASLNLNSLTLSGPSALSSPMMNPGQPLSHISPYSSAPSLHSNPPVSATAPLGGNLPTSRPPAYGPPLNNGPQFRDVPLNSSSTLNRNPIPNNVPMANYGPPTSAEPAEMRPNHLNAYLQSNQLNQYQNASVARTGFNKMWGMDYVDLMQCRNVLPTDKVSSPRIKLHQDLLDRVNCSPEIFRCTLTKIPDSNSLLQKSRLPLGILIHPFKDLNHLPVIQCSSIVRCRSCRTYINPFVYFVDSKRWKCNLCFKVNELPEEFQFDPATKSYGDPSRRPEIRASTIEFIAPAEYMLRPPQPAVYLFIFDVSKLAVDSGYLQLVCNIVSEEMSKLPGDNRTQVGFLAVDSAVHFFSIQENASQPHQMIMLDIEDVFLPCPDNLIVNLREHQELVKDLLQQLPYMFKDTFDTNCALGAALQAAFKLMSPTGGRVTVFQLCLPNVGPGALTSREDPNTRAAKDVPHLNPATDFYKRLALDCSGQQVAVDLFLLNCQYSDLATLSGICKFSGGCIYYLPLFQASKLQHIEALDKMLRRYLTRKIGFEAVMRIRCTRGLSIHTFHGNFFVRSTDLLSLPNINPDAGFGMQVTIDENLSDMQHVCFQAALLYTSSRGERRIRVHTLCLPVTTNLSDVIYSADQQCIVGMLSKMAVDRSQQASLSDAREALINAVVDALSAYKLLQSHPGGGLVAPYNLKLLPMYIIALLKSRSFRFGLSTRLDDRVFAMCQLKTLPLTQLIQLIYPDFYAVHEYVNKPIEEGDAQVTQPDRLHLSAEKLDSRGVFLLDNLDRMLLYVGKNVHPSFCYNVLGVASFAAIPEEMYGLPELDTPESERLRTLINSLQEEKPYPATLQVIRDDGHFRTLFTERLIEDRFENALSYYEFLQHIKTQVK